ncbi:MAG: elongation factor G [Spirochaetaceae bacterium]|jgi:elongation factor G|nr:elongation factor G [Spirochaetaceae bacterium]
MDFSTTHIRNIAIAGHGQTGKTTLFERLLAVAGVIGEAQTVESGKTVSDASPDEVQRHISIYAALANLTWRGTLVNLWDTPGSADFIGEVISAFRSSELALMLIDSRAGAQIETIKLWRDLDRRGKSRLVFVNRMEDPRADFAAASADIHDKFKVEISPVCIPMGSGPDYRGIIDVLHGKAYLVPAAGKKEEPVEIPAEYQDAYKDALGKLAGSAAEGDEDLLIKFIDEGELTQDEIIRGLKIALEGNRIVPALAGSVTRNSGLVPLLNFIAEIGIDPSHVLEETTGAGGEKMSFKGTAEGLLTALVVKTSNDQFSGRISYIKAASGTLKADSEVYNTGTEKKEKLGKLYRCVGKKLTEIREAAYGDICLTVKLNAGTGDTLTAASGASALTKLRLPEPVYSVALSCPDKKAEDKMSEQLTRMTEEDRTITFGYNGETRQNVISGMGELQIGIILDRIRTQQKIDITTSVPRIGYQETIQKKAQAEYTHKKQSGGHGQYARVVLSIEPLPRGERYKFTNAVFGGAIPKNYIPGVEKGVVEAMEHGILAGYPVTDVAATVLDGKDHPVDSSEAAFRIASRNAFKNSMKDAGPILLEPIMNITVWIESKYMGDVMSDITTKRGRILGQDQLPGGIVELRAQVPHAELVRYAIDLKSLTSGTGSFETAFDHYDPISGRIAEDVIKAAAEFKQAEAED